MLLEGEIDAGVVGGADLKDSRLRPVIADPDRAAQAWYAKHGALPINHMLVVKSSLRQSNPAAVKEIFRLFLAAKEASPAMALDPLQFGLKNIRRSLELIIEYSAQQKLIPRPFAVDELFDELTRELV